MRRSVRSHLAAAVAVLGLFAPVSLARAASVAAPLALGTEGPLRTLFLDVTGADARLPTRTRIDARWQGSNSWSAPTTLARGDQIAYVQLDTQADAFSVAMAAPWSSLWRGGASREGALGWLVRRLSSSVEARLTLWSGGWSDSPIETWHRSMQFTNFRRQQYPRDQVRLTWRDQDGASAFDMSAARWAFGHVVLRNQLLLASGGEPLRTDGEVTAARWAVSLRLDAKLPVGSVARLASSGGTDVGVGVFGTAELASWCVVHANLFTSAWSSLHGGTALQPATFHQGGELSVAFVGRVWALLVEDRLLSPVLAAGWKRTGTDGYSGLAASAAFAMTRPHNQISVGLRRGGVTAWFSEDFTPGRTAGSPQAFYNSNSPDISIGVALARSL